MNGRDYHIHGQCENRHYDPWSDHGDPRSGHDLRGDGSMYYGHDLMLARLWNLSHLCIVHTFSFSMLMHVLTSSPLQWPCSLTYAAAIMASL